MEYRKVIVFTLALFFGNVVRYLLHCAREQRIRPISITMKKKKPTLYGKGVTVSSVNNCMCCGWPLKYKVNQLLLGLVK